MVLEKFEASPPSVVMLSLKYKSVFLEVHCQRKVKRKIILTTTALKGVCSRDTTWCDRERQEPALGFIGSSCQNNTECSVPSSVCVNSECMCDPGLSFSPQSASCNATCTAYGRHYTTVRGFYIGGNNMATYTGVTEQQCMDHCTARTNFVCRSADWRTSDGRCDITAATLLTVAASAYYVLEDKTIITHFVRECEI
ncbi:uncharacterized protein LOC124125171 [Haliotis rufescens]|uniref:uncharacterized protein LOC124125171 n=1 Tax=Haliotis rufescens TaxID=6454 RepID=UPI00201ED473|nr:uncharacterized protein LOC124125171 [Haliotis rufescens]